MCVHVVNVRGLNSPATRKNICYVGRAFAGWPQHPLHNPFKTRERARFSEGPTAALVRCLNEYRQYLASRQSLQWDLEKLWEECEHGAKPLGCWCVDSHVGDGQEIVCHAQVLAAMLAERFGQPLSPNENLWRYRGSPVHDV